MSGWQEKVGKLLAKRREKTEDVQGLYVKGSGLVWRPSARLNEVRGVIGEHHQREVELAVLTGMVSRR
jgi:hypothetical protein